MGLSSINEFIAPSYDVEVFTDIFPSDEDFASFCLGSGALMYPEIDESFLKKVWFMLYSRYANNPICGDDENQWKYRLVMKLNAYAPTYIKKESIQAALRALNLDEMREGYKSIFNRAINPSQAPSTDNTEELPYINEQNVNKTKKNKADGYMTAWEALRSNLLEEFISKFAPLFSKIVSTTTRVVFMGDD